MSNRHRTAVSIWSTPNKRIKAFETAVPGARVVEIQRVPLPPPQQAGGSRARRCPVLPTIVAMVTGGTGLAAVFIVTEVRAQA
jgi:hypothetical protein